MNDRLKKVCAAEDVPCFDLAERIPHSEELYYDKMHFNEAGAALVGQEVASFLLESGLISKDRVFEARLTKSTRSGARRGQ